jgi:hypothetical protein
MKEFWLCFGPFNPVQAIPDGSTAASTISRNLLTPNLKRYTAHLAHSKDLPVHASQLCGDVARPATLLERPRDLKQPRACTARTNKTPFQESFFSLQVSAHVSFTNSQACAGDATLACS